MVRSFLFSLVVVLLLSGFFETTSGLTKKGNEHFGDKRYESAVEAYRKAQVHAPDRAEIRYNLGTTLYQLDQFQEAEAQLEQSLFRAKTKELQAHAWYNFGNTQYRLGQFDGAIEAYRKTLDLNPNDQDAKYNLELLQKKKAVFEKKQDERDQEKEERPKEREDDEQQATGGRRGQDQQKSPAQGDRQEDEPQQSKRDEQKAGAEEGPQPEERDAEHEQQDIQAGLEELRDAQRGEERKEHEITPGQLGKEEDQPKPAEKDEVDQTRPLLQGQMTQQDAMRILDALRESEQQLQFLRQPTPQSDHQPEKDW